MFDVINVRDKTQYLGVLSLDDSIDNILHLKQLLLVILLEKTHYREGYISHSD